MNFPLKPENSRFTDVQWQAIYETDRNLLVSASAGSGKTTVLVERVIEKIKSGINVDELLIVTYTDAAAREMKERIQVVLQQTITEESNPGNKRHLIRQIGLLPQASISTIHSFCLQVIRRYYYLIDLDPVFRLLTDDTEIALLQEDVWDEVREDLYGEEETLFKSLTAAYSNDRSDAGLTDLVFSLYEFARANPLPEKWLSQLGDLYEVKSNDLTKGVLYQQLIKPQLTDILEGLTEQAATAISIGKASEELEKQLTTVREELDLFQRLMTAVQNNHYQAAFESIRQFSFERWKAVKKSADDEVKEAGKDMKFLRDQYKKRYEEMAESYFSASPSVQVDRMEKTSQMIQEMARVAKRFTQAYTGKKRERNVLDFNDLEHLTLNILASNDEGKWFGSEASQYYRAKFKEVMVDEYQDINQLQETILFWLTQPDPKKGNLFMVGDVKQSIYSFRLADPGLFLSKYEKYGQHKNGERIVLADNFRSRSEVLDFINLVFIQLMDKSIGQMTYDTAAELVQGFTDFPKTNDHQPEILIYEKETDDDEDDDDLSFSIDTKTEGEVLIVGQKINELIHSEFLIYDKKTKKERPIRYSDIVLLTPTKKNNNDIQSIFKQLSIPLLVNDTQNYFQTTEITVMMSLLKIIDNPYQDIPLASVLRSPIVGLDENELAAIRISKKTGDYYEALKEFYKNYPGEQKASRFDSQLYVKLKSFLSQLERWREEARGESIVRLIWMIYQDTGFLDYVGGMSSGRQRKANLHALYERAASYEKTSFKGLFQFVRFIERMQKKDKDLAEPTSLGEDENVVRTMTIHASKGLEFPVVFVMDMSKKFNVQDLHTAYVFDEKYGVGTDYKDLGYRVRFSTLPEIALKTEKKKKILAEEMRKLYVALTRAEEKIFLVGSYKNEESAWKEWGLASDHQQTVLPVNLRLTANSLMQWVGQTIVRNPHAFGNDYLSIQVKNSEIQQHKAVFSISFINQESIQKEFIEENQNIDEDWLKKLNEDLEFSLSDKEQLAVIQEAKNFLETSYDYQAATRTTSYQSVSEIKRIFEEPDDDGRMAKIDINEPRNKNRYTQEELGRPSFMTEISAPTAAEIGTATHLVMQKVSLNSPPTKKSVQATIEELVQKVLIKKETAQKIDIETILRFFDSELGSQLIKDHDYVRREQPFSLLMEAGLIFDDMDKEGNDRILIHGIMDGFIEYENDVVLFDYKTDRVDYLKEKATEKMIEKYSGQMALYRTALTKILKKPVSKTYLCLLDTGDNVLIN